MGRNRTYDVIEIEIKAYDDYGRKNEVDEQSAIARNADDQCVEDSKDRYGDDGNKDDIEGEIGRGQKGNLLNRSGGGWQGQSNNRMGRGGRVRPTGGDAQPVNMQVPMMGSPFGSLWIPPPSGMQPLTPTMSPGPGPPMSPAVFVK